jgi:paired small multidrug resistance pump
MTDETTALLPSWFPPHGIMNQHHVSKWMAWCLLILTVAIDVFATTMNTRADGKILSTDFAIAIIFWILSFVVMNPVYGVIDMTIAYAVWTGLGILAAALSAKLFLNEKFSSLRCVCLVMLTVAISGLVYDDHYSKKK